MNLKLLPALLLACQVHAATLNETSDFNELYRSHDSFFDEARIIPYTDRNGQLQDVHGWVSQFGIINGGTYFFTNLFELSDTTLTNVSWNFTGNDFFMRWIVAYDGINSDLFEVGGKYRYQGSGDITMPNGIKLIAFYGTNEVTESGWTIILLSLSLISLSVYDKKTAR